MAKITVKKLASDIGTSVNRLIIQFHEAGIFLENETDFVTERDKQTLLDYLRKKTGSSVSKEVKPYRTTNKIGNPQSQRKTNTHYKNVSSKKLANSTPTQANKPAPKVFLSYSYDSPEHIRWVEKLATELRRDGIETILDTWYLHPGDPITEFMEQSIKNANFVLIICTDKYKEKSDTRIGGVGYEEAIISSDMLYKANHRKYIPVLRSNNHLGSIPVALHTKKYINLSNEMDFNSSYQDLLLTLYGQRLKPPEIGEFPNHLLGK